MQNNSWHSRLDVSHWIQTAETLVWKHRTNTCHERNMYLSLSYVISLVFCEVCWLHANISWQSLSIKLCFELGHLMEESCLSADIVQKRVLKRGAGPVSDSSVTSQGFKTLELRLTDRAWVRSCTVRPTGAPVMDLRHEASSLADWQLV